jgi:hypothetical protein
VATDATAIGPVNYLTVTATSASVEIDGIDGREKCQLWAATDGVTPNQATQSVWTLICLEALARGSEVLVVLDGVNSAQVTSIRLWPAPPRGRDEDDTTLLCAMDLLL